MLLAERESYLRPESISQERADRASRSELVELFRRRSMVHPDEYQRLFADAEAFIDLLAFAALFIYRYGAVHKPSFASSFGRLR